MPVQINRIHSPKSEIHDCKAQVAAEKRRRASFRLQMDQSYVDDQLTYIDEQIAHWEAKRAGVLQRQADAPSEIEASRERSHKAEQRLLALQNRTKLDRAEKYANQMAVLIDQMRAAGVDEKLIQDMIGGKHVQVKV